MKKETVNNDDSSDSTDTQPIHAELGHDGFQHMHNTDPVYDTLPIDDTLPLEYEFDTQKIDFEDQVFNLFDETQVMDECNFEAPANDDECEGSDRTEILSDTQVLSDDDLMSTDGDCLVDPGNASSSGYKEQSNDDGQKQSDVTSKGKQHSGSMHGGFTCIRAASIRASGLAARNVALERTKSNSCSTRSGNVPQLQISGKDGGSVNKGSFKLDNEVHLKKHHEDYYRQVNEYENVPAVNSTTARKLFSDDMVSDGGESDGAVNNCGSGEPLNSFAFENVLGGLSYIDSQEPGELSQAHALDVVDKFLQLNDVIVGNEDVSLKEFSGGKSAIPSRGAQNLAKKATSTITKHGAFKWDDNCEDEGGGEFFKSKRELIFGNGNQKQKKSRYLNSKSSTAAEKVRIKEKPSSNRKLKALVMSDSKLLSENLGRNCKSSDFMKSNKKNLIEDLNEDMRTTSRDGQVGNELDNNLAGVLDVGFDTQLAADAMEELRFGADLSCNDGTNGNEDTKKVRDELDKGQNVVKNFYREGACSGVCTRGSKKARNGVECCNKLSNSSAKQSKTANKQSDGQLVGRKPISKAKSGPEGYGRNGKKNIGSVLKMAEERGEDGVNVACVFDKHAETEKIYSQKFPMQEQLESPLPITHRSRVPLQMFHAKCGKVLNSSKEIADAAMLRNKERTIALTSATSGGESNFCDVSDKDYNPENASFRELDQFSLKLSTYPKKRRTRSQIRWAGQDANTDCNAKSKRLKRDVTSTSQINESSEQHLPAPGSKRKTRANGKSSSGTPKDASQVKIGKLSKLNTDREGNCSNQDASPKGRYKPSVSASITPVSCATPVNAASPICKGDEYHRQSCRKNLVRSTLMKELSSLSTSGKEITSPVKDSRRRRDMANVRVLFSHHTDADIVKQQKKILRRLGASEASSMSDASHFVTDIFVRTKNMLEAISFGKPVVTHLWLESCGQASCFIDERNYILRDTRKERELGFSMPASLARACQHPLLLGQKVLITPNTKPGKEILINLVKAVHGLAVERLGRSSLKDKFPEDILVLSCEEDYDICLPLLEKGTAVYSSELLLNGIVTQRLEYERHRLFTDKVKKKR